MSAKILTPDQERYFKTALATSNIDILDKFGRADYLTDATGAGTQQITTTTHPAGSITRITGTGAHVYNIDYEISKSIVSVLGYNRIRFRNSESDNKNMSYNLLFNMKFKPFWVSLSYGVIDYDDRIENLSINFSSSVFDSFILNFGFQYIINSQDDLLMQSFSLNYKI